ncbi:MAG: HEAT repeat domain-containing protein [Isosphaeraceae bacterium]
MRLKLPRFRLRLRTLVALIAVLAVSLWAGLSIWSPTRRLGRLLRADQPAFVRREAASSLGWGIPPWEVDQAVSLLIGAFDDPSPRVREYAGGGLANLGPRADRAIPKLITALGEEDRFVRSAAAGTLGYVVAAGSARRGEAVEALARALNDKDPDVRLSAAGALVKVGEAPRAAGVLVSAYSGVDQHLRAWSRQIMRDANDPIPIVAMLAPEIRVKDGRRRDEALQTLLQIGSPELVRSILNSALAADDPEVRKWAESSLGRITGAP